VCTTDKNIKTRKVTESSQLTKLNIKFYIHTQNLAPIVYLKIRVCNSKDATHLFCTVFNLLKCQNENLNAKLTWNFYIIQQA